MLPAVRSVQVGKHGHPRGDRDDAAQTGVKSTSVPTGQRFDPAEHCENLPDQEDDPQCDPTQHLSIGLSEGVASRADELPSERGCASSFARHRRLWNEGLSGSEICVLRPFQAYLAFRGVSEGRPGWGE